MVDNGIGLVQKISELEANVIPLSNHVRELNLTLRDTRSSNLLDQKPSEFQIGTPLPTESPPGLEDKPRSGNLRIEPIFGDRVLPSQRPTMTMQSSPTVPPLAREQGGPEYAVGILRRPELQSALSLSHL